MTDRRALVLAGGGLAGIAWETGVLLGISDEAPEAARRCCSSPTSCSEPRRVQRWPPRSAADCQSTSCSPGSCREAKGSHEIHPGVSVEAITDLFLNAMLTPDATNEQKLQKIGAVAAATDTVPESVRRSVIAHRLPSHEWPRERCASR